MPPRDLLLGKSRHVRAWSVGARYRLLRWALVRLRRIALRFSINFDNAVESSAKDVRS